MPEHFQPNLETKKSNVILLLFSATIFKSTTKHCGKSRAKKTILLQISNYFQHTRDHCLPYTKANFIQMLQIIKLV